MRRKAFKENRKEDRSVRLRRAGGWKRFLALLTAAGLFWSGIPAHVYAEELPERAVLYEETEGAAEEEQDLDTAGPFGKEESSDLNREERDDSRPEKDGAEDAEITDKAEETSRTEEAGEAEEIRETEEEVLSEEAEEEDPAANAAATAASVLVESQDAKTGDFVIRVSGVTLAAGESIIVPTWQDEKQTDLVWYTAEPEGEDYVVRSNVSAHGYRIGSYSIHVYRRAGDGQMNFLVKTGMEISPTAGTLKMEYAGTDNDSLKLTISNVDAYGTEKQVEFAVWSDVNGQDDLKWYKAAKSGTRWTCTLPLSNHKGKGKYHIHTYVKTKADAFACVKRSTFEVAGPAAEKIIATPEIGSASLEVAGISGFTGVESVQFAVWSVEGGQDDVKWFGQTEIGENSCIRSISMEEYKRSGIYNVHAYARLTDGSMILLGTTTMDYRRGTADEPACAGFTAQVSSGKVFTLAAKGITAPFSIEEVVIPVWHKADQSDVVWYKPVKSGQSYIVKSDISRHGDGAGTYQAHLYVKDPKGRMYCIGKTSFVTETKEVKVSASLNADQSVATLSLEGHTAPAGMKDVSFAVWSSENGQDDLKWYIAEESKGVWTYSVKISDHGSTGEYLVHCYMKTADDKSVFLGNTTFTVERQKGPDNEVTATQLSEEEYRITIQGANCEGTPAVAVSCPTWSNEGGQDDLIWYKAQKKSDGSYTVTVKRDNHSHDGLYITDIYVKNAAGKQKMVHRETYQLNKSVASQEFDAHARAVMRNIIYAVETGGQIYGNNRYDCFTEAYTNSTAETAITIGAGGWFATQAKTLLNRIRTGYPSTFTAFDTAGIAADLDNENWTYYGGDGAGGRTILKGSAKARAIQAIIGSAGGIAVQDALIDEQMIRYTDQAKSLGVSDVKARMFCANVQHLGGYSAMVRVINYCKDAEIPVTADNIFAKMREKEAGGGNTVGADKYATRHKKVLEWLNTYM